MKLILELPDSIEKHDLHVAIVPAASPTKEQVSYVPTHKGIAAYEDKKMLERLSEAAASEEATTTKAGSEVTTTKSSPK